MLDTRAAWDILPPMRNKILTLLVFALVPLTGHAAGKTFSSPSSTVPSVNQIGLGGMLGTIISGTGKYWVSEQGAIDFGVGFVSSAWVVLYGDYLWHLPRVFGTNSQFGRESSLYFGGGGGVGFWRTTGSCGHWGCDWDTSNRGTRSGTGFFIRGIAGVEWYPHGTRFGVFAEVGPSIMITPGTWGTLDVGTGGRYYF